MRSPTLAANKVVKVAIKPNLQSGDVTVYKTTIAPMSSSAAKKVLNHAMKELIARSDTYAIPFRDLDRSCNADLLV